MHKSARHNTILPGVDAISIKSDRTFPRHSHDEFGFGYIVEGGQDSWSSRGLVEALAGDTITVNPAEIHDGVGRPGQPRHWRMLYLCPAALAEFSEFQVESAQFSHPVNKSKKALRLAAEAFAAVTLDQPDQEQAEQLVMMALAEQLGPETNNAISVTSSHSRDVLTVLDMVFQSWEAPLTLATFATATGTSRFQILRRFSRELGITPHAYLTQYRVKRAKEMIVSGSSLAETAFACGFSDQSHLTRVFSRQLGVTPGCFLQKAVY